MTSKLICCEWFGAEISRAGEKGTSIIAFSDGDHRSFYIQARPFEVDVVDKYSTVDDTTGLVKWPELTDSNGIFAPFVISMDLPIRYCPSCGRDLSKMIRKNKRDFDALADSMKHLTSRAGS